MWQSAAPAAPGNGLKAALKQLIVEHGAIAARARTVRDLRMAMETRDLSQRCRIMLQNLGRLEADLRLSLFLENSVLFPRALAVQESLARSTVTSDR